MKLLKKIKYPLTIINIIVIIISLIILKRYLNNKKYNNIKENSEISLKKETTTEEKQEKENCKIDIKGAINNPGVYTVDCNDSVNDVITLAGGLKDNADTSLTNLAKKVNNEMVIIIYTKEEVKNSNIVDTVIKVVEKECVCPNIQNDSCINDKINDTITNSQNDNNLININTATKEMLLTIPGIGESKAKAIINYRETKGNFKSIEDIQNVDGIGSKLYEEIKIYITT